MPNNITADVILLVLTKNRELDAEVRSEQLPCLSLPDVTLFESAVEQASSLVQFLQGYLHHSRGLRFFTVLASEDVYPTTESTAVSPKE